MAWYLCSKKLSMHQIYHRAMQEWHRLQGFRSERARCKRYVYGDQWDDPISINGHQISEREFILSQGQVPLKNNILRRILRNVVGLYRSQYKPPRGQREWFKKNRMEELAPRLLEEFLISGLVAVRIDGDLIQPITPDNFFFHSDGYDPRGLDIDMVGEMHRVSGTALYEKFCRTAGDYRRIHSLYKHDGSLDGYHTLTEVWVKETQVIGIIHDEEKGTMKVGMLEDILEGLAKEKHPGKASEMKEMEQRIQSTTRTGWRQLWFASDGTLLRESDWTDRHPYAFKAYPFLDGEVHSYISDIIDQQRYVNRLITLYDFVMKSSAKGVLLFPDESIPHGMDLQDVANEWSRFNGVIPYRARPGVPMPTQVSGNAANIGITDLLKIEMQMLEDISGVSPTLQGKLVGNSTSGTLFAQQNEAAQTSLLDVLRTFDDFLNAIGEGSRVKGQESRINDMM